MTAGAFTGRAMTAKNTGTNRIASTVAEIIPPITA